MSEQQLSAAEQHAVANPRELDENKANAEPNAGFFKSLLHQHTQRLSKQPPFYQTFNEGVQHKPQFRSRVWLDGVCYTSTNTYTQRKAAEMDVSKVALMAITQKTKDEAANLVRQDTMFCKSILNEFAVRMNLKKPSYQIIQPNAKPRFASSLAFDGKFYTGEFARTKLEAQRLAARAVILSILDGREDDHVYVSEALMAGVVAGAVESLLSSPFELIKTRAQVTSAFRIPKVTPGTEKGAVSPLIARILRGYSPDVKALNHSVGLLSTLSTKYPNLIGSLKEYPWMVTGSGKAPPVYHVRKPSNIVSLEGWGTLWRNLRSGIVRDSIYGGIFFSSWLFLHQIMLDWKAIGVDPRPRSEEDIGPLSPLAVSLAAGFSGSVAAAASHCFDTARGRSQCIVLPKYVTMERHFLKWTLPGTRFEKYTGIHPSDRNLLFRGIWLRMARSGVSSFLFVGSYLLAIDHFV